MRNQTFLNISFAVCIAILFALIMFEDQIRNYANDVTSDQQQIETENEDEYYADIYYLVHDYSSKNVKIELEVLEDNLGEQDTYLKAGIDKIRDYYHYVGTTYDLKQALKYINQYSGDKVEERKKLNWIVCLLLTRKYMIDAQDSFKEAQETNSSSSMIIKARAAEAYLSIIKREYLKQEFGESLNNKVNELETEIRQFAEQKKFSLD